MSSTEKIAVKAWPFKLPQGGFTDLPKWKEQLPTQVLLASNLGESGATYLHYLTVFGKKSRNRFIKPLLEPVEGEDFDQMVHAEQKKHEPIYLGEYLEEALSDELQQAVTKHKVLGTKQARERARLLATCTVEDNELRWTEAASITFEPNAPTPIKESGEKPTPNEQGEGEQDDDIESKGESEEFFETQASIQVVDRTATEAEWTRLRRKIIKEVTLKATELRMEDLRDKMTIWQAADSYLRMIMLKGIEEDPSGRLARCETSSELKLAIDEYANASGVAIVATIRQMDTLFAWEWDESETVQANARSLSETGDTYLRAFHALCTPKSKAGKEMVAALPTMKVAMLLARSNNRFSQQFSSVAAMERLQKLLGQENVDFTKAYDAITQMLHQWESVDPNSGKANQSKEKTTGGGRTVPRAELDKKPCWICKRDHPAKDCYCLKDGKIDEKMLSNRMKKDANASTNSKKTNKNKKRRDRAKKARDKAKKESEVLRALAEKVQGLTSPHSDNTKETAKATKQEKFANSDCDKETADIIEAWLGHAQ